MNEQELSEMELTKLKIEVNEKYGVAEEYWDNSYPSEGEGKVIRLTQLYQNLMEKVNKKLRYEQLINLQSINPLIKIKDKRRVM